MAAEGQLKVWVDKGMHAHFVQPLGPSLPGTDWIVIMAGGGFEKRVLVRVYDHGLKYSDPVIGGKAALDYVMNLIKSGWKPYQYKGLPGELVAVPPPKA